MATEEALTRTLKRIHADPGIPRSNSTAAYWQQPPHALETIQSKNLLETADIVIIGSGITGCSVAKELLHLDPTIKITLLEARTITSGATGRNGGHIATHPIVDYSALADYVGKDEAIKICRFRLAHYDLIYDDLKAIEEELLEISEIRRVQAVCGLLDEEKLESMKGKKERFESDWPEFKGRMRIFEKKDPVFKEFQMSGVAAVAVEQSGAIWPYRMITSVFAHLLSTYSDRLTIETQTPATAITELPASEDFKYEVSTARGAIKTKQIAYCTNGYTPHLIPNLRGKLFPCRGHMSVQRPGQLFPRAGNERSWSIVWGIEGLDYITQNGKTGELFYGGGLVRGKDSGLDSMGNSRDDEEDVFTKIHLAGALPVFFGEENWGKDSEEGSRVKSTWSGVMGFTGDGLPLVGKLPGSVTGRQGVGEWFSGGYNGYGMPNAWGCGKTLARLILGRHVGEGFPESYLVTDERVDRMRGEDMVVAMFGKSD